MTSRHRPQSHYHLPGCYAVRRQRRPRFSSRMPASWPIPKSCSSRTCLHHSYSSWRRLPKSLGSRANTQKPTKSIGGKSPGFSSLRESRTVVSGRIGTCIRRDSVLKLRSEHLRFALAFERTMLWLRTLLCRVTGGVAAHQNRTASRAPERRAC